MPAAPANLLQVVRDALVAGTPVPFEASRWLLDGLEAHASGERLDKALGLCGVGQPCYASRVRRARRDVALREACALAGGVASLATALARFRSGRWRHWRDRPRPPEGASELDHLLHIALRHGPCPESVKQLRRIVTGT